MWAALRERFQSEEEPLRIVALWDGFAQEEERRCSKIVLSMDCFLPWPNMSVPIPFSFDVVENPVSSFNIF